MNPCPCGYFGDPNKECTCTPGRISRYLSKISGPLLDRFDIHLEVSPIPFDKLTSQRNGESSSQMKEFVNRARNIQLERYKDQGIYNNAQLSSKNIEKYCSLTPSQIKMIKAAFKALSLSARAYDRILKLARTIADLDGLYKIQDHHLAEAIQYRSLDREYWT
jgi:magnesium chelatase family protein